MQRVVVTPNRGIKVNVVLARENAAISAGRVSRLSFQVIPEHRERDCNTGPWASAGAGAGVSWRGTHSDFWEEKVVACHGNRDHGEPWPGGDRTGPLPQNR